MLTLYYTNTYGIIRIVTNIYRTEFTHCKYLIHFKFCSIIVSTLKQILQ